MNEPATTLARSTDRSLSVLLTMGLAVAVTGYFVGMRESRQSSQQLTVYGKEAAVIDTEHDVPTVVSYKEQPSRKLGPNRNWQSQLETLRQPAATPPPRKAPDSSAKAESLLAREAGRAFDGAPPVIPHPTPPLGVSACIACHGAGLMIGDKRASKMSHPLYANCTQCHVEVTKPDTKPFWENTFAALRPQPVERVFPGAPPVVPHPAWMRNDCQSCHGASGPAPLRTTHPERQSCLQCHALSDALDRIPLVSTTPRPKDKK